MAKSKDARVPVTVVTADVARDVFGELLDRAGLQGHRIIITRHGQRRAALVSMEDYAELAPTKAVPA